MDYLEELITEEELGKQFDIICEVSDFRMNLLSKTSAFIRRFWSDPYTENEKLWMNSFCIMNNINAKQRMQRLNAYLKKR